MHIDNVDSTPTFPLTSVQKTRFSELAAQLNVAQQQGYVESNVLAKALDLVKELAPMLLKV
jgi:hypothetical protein